MPTAEEPLTGLRLRHGALRVTKPFDTAGYCHCKRCQRRSGALWTENAIVASDGFRFTAGEDAVRTWAPENGSRSRSAASAAATFTGGRDGPFVVVRLGAVDGDPGIRPEWHAWVSSAPDWEAIPDDGLPRFEQGRGG